MAQSQAYWRPAIYRAAIGFFLVAAYAGRLDAQNERAPAVVVEPVLGGEDQSVADQPYQGPARYDEPPPPPFDGVVPTWLPCQSLRYNRSLVLGHLYFGMDIMGWATKGVHAPALVTSSPLSDGGVIGQGDTVVRFGDEFIHNETRPGGRLTIGWWFDTDQTSGFEWSYFELDGANIDFRAAVTDGNSILARPIVNAGTGLNDAVIVASDVQDGSVRVLSNMELTSTSIVFHDMFWSSPFARLDYQVGYRHTRLYDHLRIDDSITAIAGNPDFDPGDRITRVDKFRAINQFDGADFGFKGWWSSNGKLAFTTLSRFAIGANNNSVAISGYNVVRSGSDRDANRGGVLALPSNISRHSQQQFGYVSEIGVGLQWRPICQWKLDLGWTWLYWNEVARAPAQVDTTVDTNQLVPTLGSGTQPAPHLHTTSFWAQGINAAFTYDF